MGQQGFDKSTVSWSAGKVAHKVTSFPDIERVEYNGNEVRAYKDRPASLWHLFEQAAMTMPNRQFLTYPEEDCTVSYADFADRVTRVAAGLEAAGVSSGDRIAVLLDNRSVFTEVLFGAIRIGASFVPINTELAPGDLGHLLTDTDPTLLVVGGNHLRSAKDADYNLDRTTTVIVDRGNGDETQAYDTLPRPTSPAVNPPAETDTAAVIYTSGTTGRPKGCLIDHFHIVNAAMNNAFCFDFEDGTRSFVTTPLFHVSGLVSGLLSVLPVTGSVVVRDEFSPQRFLETIEEYRINYVMGVPANYILAIEQGNPEEYELSSLETCAYGSAPMPSDKVRAIREAFSNAALSNTYGKTETTSGLASMCPDEETDDHPNSIGLPTPVIEYKVVDENGEVLPPGEVGELVVRGSIVIDEYLHRSDATAESFEDGWHFTEDIGIIDEEGFITLKGRDSDIIIRGGKNVHPLKIKEALAEHEKVLESSVTGFDDAVLGQRVLATVVPKPDTRLTETELRDHCHATLADYEVPEIFRVVDSLPRNANGKVIKSELLPEPLKHGIAAGN